MSQLIDQAQPYITAIVSSLVGVLATLIIAELSRLKEKLITWIDSRTSVNQRELLQRIASEAFAHAETIYKGMGGDAKLNAALDYALQRLGTYGVNVSAEEVTAAIHSAWLKYNADTKPTVEPAGTSSEMKVI